MGRLEGKTAVVTGGGTGVGRGIARCFLEEGARVVLAQRRLEVARETALSLDPSGERCLAFQTDISNPEEVEALGTFAVEKLGGFDVLVNNASITGMPALCSFLEMDDAFIDRLVDVNLKGPVYCSRVAARHMKERGSGIILNVSSVGAFAAQENAALYCATKAAYSGLTRGMALDLAAFGIRVNGIAPGDIEIESNRNLVSEMKGLGVSGQFLRKIPLGRRGGPEEIGSVAAFLASDEASYILGQTVVVDGGFLIY